MMKTRRKLEEKRRNMDFSLLKKFLQYREFMFCIVLFHILKKKEREFRNENPLALLLFTC